MRAVIYARVSSDPTREARSVTSQIAECRAYVDRKGWTLSHEPFADSIGASRHSRGDRPQYKALISFLAAGGADVLVLWEGSRAQRDLRDYLRLRDLCAERRILYCYNGRLYDLDRTDDRFATGLDALLAEREADVIRDRVLRGVRSAAQAGRPPGRLLYGYRRVYDERGAFVRQEEHPERAPIVREIFKALDEGETCAGIARDLNERGIPAPAGGQWEITSVGRVARNPAYIGKRVYQGAVIGDAAWKPLIDERLWHRVNRMITNPGRRTTTHWDLRWQLSGLARCGACLNEGRDGRLNTLRMSRHTDRTVRTYVCKTCFGTACRTSWVDDFVSELVVARLRMPDAGWVFRPGVDEGSLAGLEAEHERLRARLGEHYAQAATGDLSAAGLAAVERLLLPQIAAAQERVQAALVPSALQGVDRRKLADGWPDAPVRLRQEVISRMADVVLDKARWKGRRVFDRWRLARSRWVGDDLTWGDHWRAAGLEP